MLTIKTSVGDSAYVEIELSPITEFTTSPFKLKPRQEVATSGESIDETFLWNSGRVRAAVGAYHVQLQVTPVDENGDGRARATGSNVELVVDVEPV
jgi:hypothetical protein